MLLVLGSDEVFLPEDSTGGEGQLFHAHCLVRCWVLDLYRQVIDGLYCRANPNLGRIFPDLPRGVELTGFGIWEVVGPIRLPLSDLDVD